MSGGRSGYVSGDAPAGPTPLGLALRLLAPYLSVLVFWVVFDSAWLAILGYHLQIVLWFRHDRRGLSGLMSARLLVLAVPSVVAGPVVYLLLPRIASVEVGTWLAGHGLSGGSLLAIALYFGFVHPPLEQLHWAPLRERTAWAHVLFAGYHVIVLAGLLPLPWLLACFAVLAFASWMWREMQERSGALLVPIASHVLADAGIVAAAVVLARA